MVKMLLFYEEKENSYHNQLQCWVPEEIADEQNNATYANKIRVFLTEKLKKKIYLVRLSKVLKRSNEKNAG